MSCLTEEVVAEFVEGRLATDRAAEVDRHVAECEACRSLVADVAKMAFDDGDEGARTPRVGDTVGRYRIVEIVGVGGMGIVYGAEDPELGRRIALKLIRADRASTSGIELTRRLHQEARAMAKISHPNVVTVHDIGTIGNHLFVAMEYVQGTTLRAWRTTAPRTWREILEAFIAAGRGLAAAHAVGLVHRDFKPENVLYGEDGRVRVTDFGLARGDVHAEDTLSRPLEAPRSETEIAGSSTLTTPSGEVVGTPAYMALEQLNGAPPDARSDQFSFCVSLFEALYDLRPYPAKNLRELVRVLGEGRVATPPPDTEVPTELHRIVLRGLRPAPNDRFGSIQALLDELAVLLPKPSLRRSAVEVPTKRPSPRVRSRGLWIIAGVIAVASIGGLVWRLTPKRPAPADATTFPRLARRSECFRGAGLYCTGHGAEGEQGRLYRCTDDGTISEEKTCPTACLHLGRGGVDACDGDGPACPFNGTGVYCGYNYLSASPKILYRCTAGNVTVEQECRSRCIEEPDHVADHCD